MSEYKTPNKILLELGLGRAFDMDNGGLSTSVLWDTAVQALKREKLSREMLNQALIDSYNKVRDTPEYKDVDYDAYARSFRTVDNSDVNAIMAFSNSLVKSIQKKDGTYITPFEELTTDDTLIDRSDYSKHRINTVMSSYVILDTSFIMTPALNHSRSEELNMVYKSMYGPGNRFVKYGEVGNVELYEVENDYTPCYDPKEIGSTEEDIDKHIEDLRAHYVDDDDQADGDDDRYMHRPEELDGNDWMSDLGRMGHIPEIMSLDDDSRRKRIRKLNQLNEILDLETRINHQYTDLLKSRRMLKEEFSKKDSDRHSNAFDAHRSN